MGWLRKGFVVTGLAGAGLLALTLVDCAEPTQIVVEVYSDACNAKPKSLQRTGIAVGRASEIDSRPFAAFRPGCETSQGVGTLTIYPSGAKDEEVAIKVVGGIDVTPELCMPPGYAGCIAHRRIMHFVPNQTQRAIVRLSLACLNRVCQDGFTCDEGVCKKDEDLLEDGGTRDDASTAEASVIIGDGAVAPPVDAAADACYGCKGLCSGTDCRVNCASGNCMGELCAKALPCVVTCPTTGQCNDITCTSDTKCDIHCGPAQDSCKRVVCNARDCKVACEGNRACDGNGNSIILDAGNKAELSCTGNASCSTVASCKAAKCELTCQQGGPPGQQNCPNIDAGTCAGDCTKWNPPIPPD